MCRPVGQDLITKYFRAFKDSLVIFPALEVDGREEEEDASVGGVLPPQLHGVLLGIFIITSLK